MAPARIRERTATVMLSWGHTIALSMYLPLFMYVSNTSFVEVGAFFRATAITTAAAVFAVWALRAVLPDLGVRAVLVSVVFVSFAVKNLAGAFLHVPVLWRLVCTNLHLVVDVAALGTMLWVGLRLRGRALRETQTVLSTIAVVTLGVSVGQLLLERSARNVALEHEAVAGLQHEALAQPLSPQRTPDIYYIIVDSYPRADTWSHLYGVEADPLQEYLEAKGFHVASDARTNYPWTLLSVASSLNLSYLDQFDAELWDQTGPRPLVNLIQDSAAVRQLQALGYRVTLLASGLAATSDFAAAADVECGDFEVTEYETQLLSLTPFNRAAYRLHRDTVKCQLSVLPRVATDDTPDFVFAHIMAPHPPFVFDADGCELTPAAPFRFADGVCSVADYVPNFRRQNQFVAGALQTSLRGILERSDEPPVIIVQSDHGPGSQLNYDEVDKTNITERFGILSAYLLPGAGDSWQRERMSPVNNFRIVANAYFGAEYELLEDRSYFAPISQLFAFTDVTHRVARPPAHGT